MPTEGWDAISPLAAMDPKRAPILDNWVPRTGWVELRQGYSPFSILTSTPVETIAVRRPAAGSEAMFAASGGTIWEVGAGSAVGAGMLEGGATTTTITAPVIGGP